MELEQSALCGQRFPKLDSSRHSYRDQIVTLFGHASFGSTTIRSFFLYPYMLGVPPEIMLLLGIIPP